MIPKESILDIMRDLKHKINYWLMHMEADKNMFASKIMVEIRNAEDRLKAMMEERDE